MNKFILAFPVPVKRTDTFKITEHVQVTADTTALMIPGCTVSFSVARTDYLARLSDVFREHSVLSDEEAKAIDSHCSLIFLLGTLKNADDFLMVNSAILKMFDAGAIGVYMQQSGTAWVADHFREEIGDGDMYPWINYLEKDDSFYTLGLEVFGLPDLCFSRKMFDEGEEYEFFLSHVATLMFMEGVPSKSGTVVDADAYGKFTLRAEITSPFAKDAPEYNKNGIMRLVGRQGGDTHSGLILPTPSITM